MVSLDEIKLAPVLLVTPNSEPPASRTSPSVALPLQLSWRRLQPSRVGACGLQVLLLTLSLCLSGADLSAGVKGSVGVCGESKTRRRALHLIP